MLLRKRGWLATVLTAIALSSPALAQPNQPALEELGKQVFFDNISNPTGMGCASCHVPAAGWASNSTTTNAGPVVVAGVTGASGRRRPPTNAYASFSPVFAQGFLCTLGLASAACSGGAFWDGRASGSAIGNEVFRANVALQSAYAGFLGPVADQALGPFANTAELNMPRGNDNGLPAAEGVCRHVAAAPYAVLYRRAWGESIDCETTGVDISFKRIAVAISAWEHSAEINQFSSRRDQALAADPEGAFPLAGLSNAENLGHDLFFGIVSALNPGGKNAQCGLCHNSEGAGSTGSGAAQQLYTDHSYHNIGVPPNYDIASFDPNRPDFGLAEVITEAPALSPLAGAFKTPTLRNVDQRPNGNFTKAYMHNGYFKRLEDVVHFYNTATIKLDAERCPRGTTAAQARSRDCWPAPETSTALLATTAGLVGNLGLTPDEEAAIVAYLRTLSDTEPVSPPAAVDPDDDSDGSGGEGEGEGEGEGDNDSPDGGDNPPPPQPPPDEPLGGLLQLILSLLALFGLA